MHDLTVGLLHPGPAAFLREYLGDAPHDVPFVGRVAELSALSAWLEGETDRALVVASAGKGKSALLVRFAASLVARGHAVAWLPISLRFGTHRSQTIDALLTDRLGAIGAPSGHWKDVLASDGERPLLVVIDGLDEAQDGAFLEALRALPLGRGVRVLVAARALLDRDAQGWKAWLAWPEATVIELGALSLSEITAALPADRASAPRAAGLLTRTGGDPLLLRLCLEALAHGEPLPTSSDPISFVGSWWAAQQASMPAPRSQEARRALGALGAACGVVPWEILAAATGDEIADVRAALTPFARFVRDVPGQGVTFAHPRFADVAWETLPEETAAMRARFGEQVRVARQSDDPHPYWLHFGLAHLIAADAPDDAFAELLTRSSMLAWRRLEGDLHGLRDEAEALRARTVKTVVASAPGEAGYAVVLRALEQVRFSQKIVDLLQDLEDAVSPAFRVAQVDTGLRPIASALDSALAVRFRQGDEHDLDDVLRPVLPRLPDVLLAALLGFRYRVDQHRAEIVRLLHERGLPALAIEVLLAGPELLGPELVLLAPLMQPADVARAAEAIVSYPGMLYWPHRLRSVRPALSLLPEARGDEVWGQLWSQVSADEEPWEEVLVAAVLAARRRAQRHAERGEEDAAIAALRALEPIFARAAPFENVDQFWTALTEAVDALGLVSKPLAERAESVVDALTFQLVPTPDGWPPLLLWRSRSDWWSRAEAAATEAGFLVRVARQEKGEPFEELPLPEAWRERVEAAVVAKLRADLCAGEAPSRHELETYRLRSREGFWQLVPLWLSSLEKDRDSQVGCLCRVLAQQGGFEGDPRARQALEELADRGAPVWEIEGWDTLWPLSRRRALVTQRLAQPPRLTSPEHYAEKVAPVSRHIDALPEAHATRRLRKRLACVIGAHCPNALVTLLACSPLSEQASLLDELFFTRSPFTYFDRDHRAPTSDRLLALVEDPALREAAARHLLSQPDDESLESWPSLAIASLPVEERPAAERALVAHLRRHDFDLPSNAPVWVHLAWLEARAGEIDAPREIIERHHTVSVVSERAACTPFEARFHDVCWSHRLQPVEAHADALVALRSDEEWGMQPSESPGYEDEPASRDLCWLLYHLARPGLAAAVLERLLARRPLAEHRANVVALWPAIPPDEHQAVAPLVDAAVNAASSVPWRAGIDEASMLALVSEDTAKALWATRPEALEARLPKDERQLAHVQALLRAYAVFGFEL